MSQHQSYIVFDLETQRRIDEVGGRSNFHQLGMSVAVLYDSASDSTEVYREEQANLLLDRLGSAPLIVGFNIIHFDFPVLSGYGALDFRTLPTVDLMQHIVESAGFRLSLDNLVRTTLNAQKSASGLQAIQWFQDGNWQDLIDYCHDDVLLTRDLYEFGKEHGYVSYFDRKYRVERKIKVAW
ncbi:ribonuclease H-like domain-containing protein [candidate division KSB1 bacterium]|nr:ribonuclease H-like domain-containing protein [candidate division KSB1 bacterium]